MIAITGIPAVMLDDTVSPELISYLVATDAPVIFRMERREGVIDSAADQGGFVRLTLEAGHEIQDDDKIGVYDAGRDVMVIAEVSIVSTNVFDTDIPWEARFASELEYCLNYTRRQNYFAELRLTINGLIMDSTIRATPDTKGNLMVDVSPFLRSQVTGEKAGQYIDDIYVENMQSGIFTLEFRERYDGDDNPFTDEGNTWYYVMAIRTKEQGANLAEYLAHGDTQGKFFNEFQVPVWTVGTPMDLSFFWPPWYDNLELRIYQYSAANVMIGSTVKALDDAGKGRLNSAKINMSSIIDATKYLNIEIVAI